MNPRRILVVSLSLGLILAGLLAWLAPTAPPPDSTAEPVDYSSTPGWIDVAFQPLAIPTGLMADVMNHDRILRDQLAQSGLKLHLVPAASGEEINQRASSGKPEMAFIGDLPALRAAATRDVRILALAKMAFASLVARAALPVSSLRGKRIANVTGSSAHLMILQALQQAGINEADVTLVETPVQAMTGALANGDVDAFAAWEPTPTRALTEHPEFAIIHRLMTYSYMYINHSFAERTPHAAQALLSAYLRSIQWMNAHSNHLRQACRWNIASAQQFTGRPPRLNEEECATIARRDLLDPTPTAVIHESLLEDHGPVHAQFQFLQHQKLIPPDLSWEQIRLGFDPAPARRLIADSVGYKLREFAYDE